MKKRMVNRNHATGGRGHARENGQHTDAVSYSIMRSAGGAGNKLDLFSQLDDALLAHIFKFLPSPKDLGSASSVCHGWNRVSKSPAVTSQFKVGIQLTKHEQGRLSPMITRGNKSPINGLASSGSKLFSFGLQESNVRVWNISSRMRSGSMRCEHVVRTGFPITAIAACGSRLFAACTDLTMHVWNLDDAGSRKPLLQHSLQIHGGILGGQAAPVCRMLTSGSSLLFTCNAKGGIWAWDISDEERRPVLVCVVQPNQEPSDNDEIVGDESRLFYASSAGIKAWKTGALNAEPICFGKGDGFPTLAISGDRLYASSSAVGIKVWGIADVPRPACLHVLPWPGVTSLCAWNGYLFAGTLHGTAVWDVRRETFRDRHEYALVLRSGKLYEIMTGLQVVGGELYAAVGLMGSGEGHSLAGNDAGVRRDDKHVIAAWCLQGGA